MRTWDYHHAVCIQPAALLFGLGAFEIPCRGNIVMLSTPLNSAVPLHLTTIGPVVRPESKRRV